MLSLAAQYHLRLDGTSPAEGCRAPRYRARPEQSSSSCNSVKSKNYFVVTYIHCDIAPQPRISRPPDLL